MNNSKLPKTSHLNQALVSWSVEKDVTDFIKERLGLKNEGSNKNHAEDIIDHAIDKAKNEEKPEWTSLLLNQIKPDKKENTSSRTQTIFNIATNVTNDTLEKLVDVTPVKTPIKKMNKIEELI